MDEFMENFGKLSSVVGVSLLLLCGASVTSLMVKLALYTLFAPTCVGLVK